MNNMQVNRRDFIGMAAGGVGAVVATSSLPALGKDDPSLFPKRGVVERMAIAYQHIHLGLPQPFSVLHISDTHLTFANPDEPESVQKYRRIRTDLFGGRQFEALKDSIRWAKINTDYLIHTGDLMDFVSSNILLPLGGVLIVIFVGWRLGKAKFFEEVTNEGTIKASLKKIIFIIIRYLAPIAITIVFIRGLIK
jgi:hypothetical protein